jgi:hypothetical protein
MEECLIYLKQINFLKLELESFKVSQYLGGYISICKQFDFVKIILIIDDFMIFLSN